MSPVTSDLDTRIGDRLRAVDQRYTSGRQRIVHALQQADRPLTVPELLASDPSIPASSAYRNLSVLVDAAVVARIVTNNEHAHFELDSDYTEHHHHLVCQVCGTVTDFTLGDKAERELDEALARVAHEAGYVAADHRLDVVGICPTCA